MKQTFRRRPLRLGRVFEASPLYFVTFCTHNRIACLAREDIHAAFVLFARRAEREFNVAIGRYVIMPDHVHLFVRGGLDFTLGRWVGLLKQALARAANPPRASTQFWQEGFFDHVMRSDESYSQKWTYVRENPVRAGFDLHKSGRIKVRSFTSTAHNPAAAALLTAPVGGRTKTPQA